jgi:hypothetical protein
MKPIQTLVCVLTLLFSCALHAESITGNQKVSNAVYIDAAVKGIPQTILKASSTTLQLFTHGHSGELLVNGEWKNAEAIAVWLKESFQLSHYNHICHRKRQYRFLHTA